MGTQQELDARTADMRAALHSLTVAIHAFAAGLRHVRAVGRAYGAALEAYDRTTPERVHCPRHEYDCAFCKFNWNCGPLCACGLRGLPPPPKRRAAEVGLLQLRWRKERGYE